MANELMFKIKGHEVIRLRIHPQYMQRIFESQQTVINAIHVLAFLANNPQYLGVKFQKYLQPLAGYANEQSVLVDELARKSLGIAIQTRQPAENEKGPYPTEGFSCFRRIFHLARAALINLTRFEGILSLLRTDLIAHAHKERLTRDALFYDGFSLLPDIGPSERDLLDEAMRDETLEPYHASILMPLAGAQDPRALIHLNKMMDPEHWSVLFDFVPSDLIPPELLPLTERPDYGSHEGGFYKMCRNLHPHLMRSAFHFINPKYWDLVQQMIRPG